MRLASFSVSGPLGPVPRVMAASESEAGRLIDLTAAGERWWQRRGCGDPGPWAAVTFPADLTRLLRGAPASLEMAAEALSLAEGSAPSDASPGGARLSWGEGEVERLPLLRPPLLRDFYAFEGHVAAGARRRGEDIPEPWFRRPVYYKGNPGTLLPPGATVPWPAYTDRLDYELEIACVVLASAPDLSVDQAAAAIAGYTLFCDFSARDVQADEMRVRLGPAKSKDFASGLGPWLVTADELPHPERLEAAVLVNGKQIASGRMADSRWSFPQMVSYASGAEPLEAGEVICSGTITGGSGQEQGRFLEPGDRVELRMEGVGSLIHGVGPRHQGGGGLVVRAPEA